MNVSARVKLLTQRLTIPICVVVAALVPFLMAWLGAGLKIWSAIDALYPTKLVWFWGLMIATRFFFAVAWVFFYHVPIIWANENGFLWFAGKPENTNSETEDTIMVRTFKIIIVVLGVCIVSELAIRLSLWNMPVYFK